MPVSGTSRIVAFAATALLIDGAAARTIEPVSNFEDMPIRVAMTVSQVREAIIGAAASIPSRPWAMADSGHGKLIGSLHVRRHQAVVEVTYSADRYSIVYLNSSRLNYRDGSVNAAYNNWVRELHGALEAALNPSAKTAPPGATASSLTAVPAAAIVPTAGGAASPAEIAFWESVRNSGDPKELQAYLDQFPDGVFAPLAKARIAAMGAKR